MRKFFVEHIKDVVKYLTIGSISLAGVTAFLEAKVKNENKQ